MNSQKGALTIYLADGDIDINMYGAHFNLITIWPSKRYLNERVFPTKQQRDKNAAQ